MAERTTGSVIWFRGVPWDAQALHSARAEGDPGLVEVVTEIAREIRLTRKDRPEPGAQIRAERGGWTAILSGELVVMGYGRAEEVLRSASEGSDGSEAPDEPEKPRKATGRGPVSREELIEWLADEGFQVVLRSGRGHHDYVVSPQGVRLITLPGNGKSRRSLLNNVATCRRVLGIELRRDQ